MFLEDKVTVPEYYTSSTLRDFFGFVPVLDCETHSYYSVENEHPDAEFKRVTPVFGGIRNAPYCMEEYFLERGVIEKKDYKKSDISGTYEQYLEHYKKVLDNIKNNPYLLTFVGCDDGDTGIRFPDKETALKYAQNEIVYFDEVYEDKRSMRIN